MNTKRKLTIAILIVLSLLIILGNCTTSKPAWFAPNTSEDNMQWIVAGRKAIINAMSQLSVSIKERNLLVLTNAGYGTIDGQSTETFLNELMWETGCSMGGRSLLSLHCTIQEPLWFSLYQKNTGQLIFIKWMGGKFEQQIIDASPEHILSPEIWEQTAKGIIGSKMFNVVSIFLTWTAGPSWTLLTAAAFHDHFCPGVNAGYIIGQYLLEKMPLGQGDKYIFVTAPGICPADALQVMFNATAGKSSGYTMTIDNVSLAEYSKEGKQPALIAMRVNSLTDVCEGKVLGFDWNMAGVDTKVPSSELSPPGGWNNPLFWISRVKMSRELVLLPKEKLINYVYELHTFSGTAAFANKVAAGNPYKTAWEK